MLWRVTIKQKIMSVVMVSVVMLCVAMLSAVMLYHHPKCCYAEFRPK